MNIGRRSFLSFIIGGAAGTALTPLPLKLTDDLSIWTQMWPWTPVPKRGAVTYTNTAAPRGLGAGGLSVRKVGERVVKVEGMPDYPLNDGGTTLPAVTATQYLYTPTRITSPLKRIGNGADDRFEPISWEEALKTLVEHLTELRKKGFPHTVAGIYGDSFGTVPNLFSRFFTAYGSPNLFYTPSMADTYRLVFQLMHGQDALVGFDAENADYIIGFGTGVLDGWGTPAQMFQAFSTWRDKKATFVQVEPRLSNTAAKADRWIPIKPGTEDALALGMIHVIFEENLQHEDFVENYTTGLLDETDDTGKAGKGLRSYLAENYAVDQVASITGIAAEKIVTLAKDFAKAEKPLALFGHGAGTTPGRLKEAAAIHVLNAVVGAVNRKGGVYAIPTPDYIYWGDTPQDETARKGNQTPRIDGADKKPLPVAESLIHRLPEAMAGGKVNALFVAEANPCYTMPDCNAMIKAMESVPFVVSFSSFMDETAMRADLILPNHFFLERYEDIPAPTGSPKLICGLCRPVADPLHNTRHTGDVLIETARAMGGTIAEALPWKDYLTCLKETLGDYWEKMESEGFAADANYRPKHWDSAFKTKSGKLEVIPKALQSAENDTPAPYNADNVVPGDAAQYPLILIAYDSMRINEGYYGNAPFATKTIPETVLKKNDMFVEINPETARQLGFGNGAYARLTTPVGEAVVRIHSTPGIMPGIIAAPRGLGHTAYDDYLAGKGVNVNELIGPVSDPYTGLNAARGIRAKLTRA